jgi:hypothetical protein
VVEARSPVAGTGCQVLAGLVPRVGEARLVVLVGDVEGLDQDSALALDPVVLEDDLVEAGVRGPGRSLGEAGVGDDPAPRIDRLEVADAYEPEVGVGSDAAMQGCVEEPPLNFAKSRAPSQLATKSSSDPGDTSKWLISVTGHIRSSIPGASPP